MKTSIQRFAALAFFLFAAAVSAGTNGTYVMDGGAYSINVEFVAEGLQIVEPNKTSLYTSTSPGVYEFTNPNNGIHYGLRVIDENTIEAFKPGSAQPGTVLKRSGGAAMVVDEDNPNYAHYAGIAEKYASMIESDPDSVHAWSACAAAALAWAHMPAAEATQLVIQSATMLKSIMGEGSPTPCDDAIPGKFW
ncbi:MAG: hypothetical protein ACREV5_22195 [Steroidobacter sp.]